MTVVCVQDVDSNAQTGKRREKRKRGKGKRKGKKKKKRRRKKTHAEGALSSAERGRGPAEPNKWRLLRTPNTLAELMATMGAQAADLRFIVGLWHSCRGGILTPWESVS